MAYGTRSHQSHASPFVTTVYLAANVSAHAICQAGAMVLHHSTRPRVPDRDGAMGRRIEAPETEEAEWRGNERS